VQVESLQAGSVGAHQLVTAGLLDALHALLSDLAAAPGRPGQGQQQQQQQQQLPRSPGRQQPRQQGQVQLVGAPRLGATSGMGGCEATASLVLEALSQLLAQDVGLYDAQVAGLAPGVCALIARGCARFPPAFPALAPSGGPPRPSSSGRREEQGAGGEGADAAFQHAAAAAAVADEDALAVPFFALSCAVRMARLPLASAALRRHGAVPLLVGALAPGTPAMLAQVAVFSLYKLTRGAPAVVAELLAADAMPGLCHTVRVRAACVCGGGGGWRG
jgi:hypothetical protein